MSKKAVSSPGLNQHGHSPSYASVCQQESFLAAPDLRDGRGKQNKRNRKARTVMVPACDIVELPSVPITPFPAGTRKNRLFPSIEIKPV